MSASSEFERLASLAETERRRMVPEGPPLRAAADVLFAHEIYMSTALAGAVLSASEVATLVERGATAAARPLEQYVLVADYAEAARYVRNAPAAGRRRPYLSVEEVVHLHGLCVRRSLHDRPGTWRATTIAAFAGGMVAPPAWRVPQAVANLVERLALGPAAGISPLYWVAEGHERFERIHPFATANGRVGRLVANILLRRLAFPPLLIEAREAGRYFAALARADSGDTWPLASVFARGVLASFTRLAAAQAVDGLRPLATLADAGERAALYKAAQRGSLPALRRGGRLLTTQAWIDAYRRERATRDRTKGGALRRPKETPDGDDSRDAQPR